MTEEEKREINLLARHAHFGPTLAPDDNRFFAEVRWPTRSQPPQFVRRLPEQGW
jgi:hypothetical protein